MSLPFIRFDFINEEGISLEQVYLLLGSPRLNLDRLILGARQCKKKKIQLFTHATMLLVQLIRTFNGATDHRGTS